jgi:rubrerythrin
MAKSKQGMKNIVTQSDQGTEETMICNECGYEWVDCGEDECANCHSKNFSPVIED